MPDTQSDIGNASQTPVTPNSKLSTMQAGINAIICFKRDVIIDSFALPTDINIAEPKTVNGENIIKQLTIRTTGVPILINSISLLNAATKAGAKMMTRPKL